MAYIGMQFDANQVEPSTSFDVIPAGKYHVQIVNSEMRPTKSGTGRYLWLELSIMDGPHATADRRSVKTYASTSHIGGRRD